MKRAIIMCLSLVGIGCASNTACSNSNAVDNELITSEAGTTSGIEVLPPGISRNDEYSVTLDDTEDRLLEIMVPFKSVTRIEFKGCSVMKKWTGGVREDNGDSFLTSWDGRFITVNTDFKQFHNKTYPVNIVTKKGTSHRIMFLPQPQSNFSMKRVETIVIKNGLGSC